VNLSAAMANRCIAVALVVAVASAGCAATQRHESEAGPNGSRIYRTTDGDTLRVDAQGMVHGYPGNKRFAAGEHGVAPKVGEEWDMSSFGVKPAAEGCGIVVPAFHSDEVVKQRSQPCWNLAWEIPALIVTAPFLIIGAVLFGLVIMTDAAISGK
jgi:hypothetical protein